MRRHTMRYLSAAATALFLAVPFAALAQQPAQTATPTEIPARLRHLEGTVTVQRAAAGDTEAAVINLPIGSGDRVWSDEDGRVEIMFEDGTSLWLDARTTLDFVSLPRPDELGGTLLRLWTGSLYVQRPTPQSGNLVALRLDAPTGSISFDEPGLFRVDLDEDQTLWLSAYDGAALLDAGGLSELVLAGQRTLAETGSAPARAAAFNTSEVDDFGDWRDQRVALFASTHQFTQEREYLPDNIVHYAADLEPYGSWSYHPTYSAWYWKPYAAVAWAPYRHGRWVYTYAGWSWVPAASWGYVTTHYGRWQYTGGGWGWFPGSVWAPASVQWSVGGGYVGWAPLNYWGQPAVGFGAYVGGGVSIGISFGGYWGYRDPYWGWGGSWWGWGGGRGWGHRPCYGCCYRCGGGGWGGGWGRPGRYPSYGGRGYPIGPIGSASGTGRVVNGRGYRSGLDDAWTMVPAEDFTTRDTGRVAVARSALPTNLDQATRATMSGNMRARQPSTLVPDNRRTARPTTASARQAVSPAATSGATRATSRNTPTTLDANAQRRAATARSSSGADSVTGAQRATSRTPTATRRAQVNSRARTSGANVAPGASRATSGAATTSRRNASVSSGTARRALVRNPLAAPRTSTRSTSGAARQALSRSAPGTSARTPLSGATRSPSRRSAYPNSGAIRSPSTRSAYPSTGAARYPSTSGAYPNSGASRRSMSAPRTSSPSSVRRSPTVRNRTSSPAVRYARPPSSGGALRAPSSVRRPSSGVRSGVSRPPASRGGGGGIRPSAGRRPSGGVRPSAGARRGGGGARPAARSARPRGGGSK